MGIDEEIIDRNTLVEKSDESGASKIGAEEKGFPIVALYIPLLLVLLCICGILYWIRMKNKQKVSNTKIEDEENAKDGLLLATNRDDTNASH